MGAVVVGWIVAAAAYVLFAGQFSTDEAAAAAICGLIASLWSASIRRVASRRFLFGDGGLGASLRALGGLPGATGRIGLVLIRALGAEQAGETKRESFIQGRVEDPADAGRRAVAVLARSLAPDSFVVRTPQESDSIEIHALVKTSRADPRWAV